MSQITYKISGKHDGKGIKDAKSGMDVLGNSAKTLKTVLGGLAAVFTLRAAIKGITDVTQAFNTQQKSLALFTQAVSNNSKLSSDSLKNLISLSGDLQKKSIFGDEVIQEQMAYIAGLGHTEDTIKKVTEAAIELTSAGIGSLESNVKNLTKTLNGNRGELGETIGEMKNLTEAQLRNGEVVDIVLAKYKGSAQAMAQTLEGRETQFSNMFGDLKETIGAISAVLKFEGLGKLMPVLQDIQDWFTRNQEKIINFFLYLPEIGGLAFQTIKDMLRTIFTLDFWVSYLDILGQFWIKTFLNAFKIIDSVVNALAVTIWEPLKWGFEIMIWGITVAFTTVENTLRAGLEAVLNFFLGGINTILSGINKIKSLLPGGGGKQIEMISTIKVERMAQPPAKPTLDTGAMKDAWKTVGTSTVDGFKDTIEDWTTANKSIGGLFGDTFSKFTGAISSIFGRELPDNIKKILDPALNAVQNSGSSASGGGETTTAVTTTEGGQGGQGGFWAELMSSIMSVIQSFSLVSSIVSALGPILNPLLIIFEGIMSVLQPIIDSLLEPLIGILRIIGIVLGTMLAPAFKMLEYPIKMVASAFVFIYNYALRPFGNLVIKLMTTLWNAFRSIINGIIKLINKLPGVNIKKIGALDVNYLDKISMSDLNEAGSETGTGTSSSSSSASYTGAREMYINIFFNNSYVNGDARSISLMLRDEIASAEALGM